MEAVKGKIRSVLPNILETTLEQVVNKLETDGVASCDDLEYVTASDLAGILKPIETRKLLRSWTPSEEVTTVSASNTPATIDLTVNPLANRNAPLLPSSNSPITVNLNSHTDPTWPHKMEIPYNQLPASVTRLLEKGERLVGRDRKSLIHAIVRSVHQICTNPTKNQILVISKKVFDKYPNAITDQINGSIIGSGYENFARQLINRSENQNRQSLNPLKRRLSAVGQPDGEESTSTRKTCPKKQRDSYGCVNWQPAVVDINSQNKKKEEMKNVGEENVTQESSVDMLLSTYPLQRQVINKGDISISQLALEWPLLFTEVGMLIHFKELTGCDLREKIISEYKEKAGRIMKFSSCGALSAKLNRVCAEVLMDLTAAKAITRDEKPCLLAVMRLIMKHMDEEEHMLFHEVDEHAVSSEVDLRSCPSTPFLVACGDSLLLARRFMLVVDRTIVIPRITSVLSALALLFASFYCFNVEYPEKAARTLEFIQRCFVGINPEKGSKAACSKKKNPAMNPRVLALITSVADFDWFPVFTD